MEELTLQDDRNFILEKRRSGVKATTCNFYNSSICFLYKHVLHIPWNQDLQFIRINFDCERLTMLTTETTPEMITEWRKIFESRHSDMYPNRKTGIEVDAYFKGHYPYQTFNNEEFRDMVAADIMENDFLREKLPKGVLPDIKIYTVGDVLIGIDINSGEFHVESEDIGKAVAIYDDLFAFRGLDEKDLNNVFLVAEYIKLSEK